MKRVGSEADRAVREVVGWFVGKRLRDEAATQRLPFYCDPERVGHFAVEPEALAAGSEAALFRLFVALTMYQALRDRVIMAQQRAMSRESSRCLVELEELVRTSRGHACVWLHSVEDFESGCDVSKDRGLVDCGPHPGLACQVKSATVAYNRMGDLGKLPTSALLRLWAGGVKAVLAQVCREEASPALRAERLVVRFSEVHRVGRKLATLFVSALSTPALAPGLTPWFPEVDGHELVVVDTHVARAIERLGGGRGSYSSAVEWVRARARQIDLSAFRPDWPSYAPRLVQEALYAFGSASNRQAAGDPCASAPCSECVPSLCPFGGSEGPHR